MPKVKLFQNRLFVYLITIYLLGIVFGIIFVETNNYEFSTENKNYFIVFFSNYWYIFLIWIFGFSVLGYIITTIIVFFRAFIFGILIKVLILNSFSTLVIMLLLELFIAIPLLLTIAYFSIALSKESIKIIFKSYTNSLNLNKYINLMLIATVVMALYSLIIFLN